VPLTGYEQKIEHRQDELIPTLRVALTRKRQAESFCRRSDHGATVYMATGINAAMIMRIIKFALCSRTSDRCY